jgi:hypothetical protein
MPSDLPICFFIDGLDEYTDKIHSLLQGLYILQGAPRVKTCVSSRPEQFVLGFHDAVQLMLQDFNQKDIPRTVEDELLPDLQRFSQLGERKT